jgi:D-3-phosphoglycerate dehydrogenase
MSTPVRVVRTDAELACPAIDAGLGERGCAVTLLPSAVDEATLADAVADADLLLTCYARVSEAVIAAAPRLRGIVKYGVGIDAIDVPAAMARGIPVVNVPEYAEETVAEGAFALLLALAKGLIPVDREMHARGWLWPEPRWLARDVAGMTVGLVGVGRIGRSFARMARAGFRARVLGFDPYVSAGEMRAAGVEKHEDLHVMLAQCDAVSIHCVLNAHTRHLIDTAALAAMKPTALLINVSRGALVDEAALREALLSARIAGAGLDVFSDEPLGLEGHPLSELFILPNVILSPHITFYTREAMQRLESETLARCDELLAGGPVLVKSRDPRLRAQARGVRFGA